MWQPTEPQGGLHHREASQSLPPPRLFVIGINLWAHESLLWERLFPTLPCQPAKQFMLLLRRTHEKWSFPPCETYQDCCMIGVSQRVYEFHDFSQNPVLQRLKLSILGKHHILDSLIWGLIMRHRQRGHLDRVDRYVSFPVSPYWNVKRLVQGSRFKWTINIAFTIPFVCFLQSVGW